MVISPQNQTWILSTSEINTISRLAATKRRMAQPYSITTWVRDHFQIWVRCSSASFNLNRRTSTKINGEWMRSQRISNYRMIWYSLFEGILGCLVWEPNDVQEDSEAIRVRKTKSERYHLWQDWEILSPVCQGYIRQLCCLEGHWEGNHPTKNENVQQTSTTFLWPFQAQLWV